MATQNTGKPAPPSVRRAHPYRFEVRKKPRCDNCDVSMRLERRAAHPTRGDGFELHTFRCPDCGNTVAQDAAASPPGGRAGNSPSAEA
jgi:hypothetical protein